MFSINILNKYLNQVLLLLLIFINNNYKKFIKFLTDKNIIQMIIGIIIGSQVSTFTNLLNSVIFTPIINYFNSYNNIFEKYNYNLINIKFEYGKLILGLIQLIVSFIIIYIFWSLSQLDTYNLIDNKLTNSIVLLTSLSNNSE